MVFDGLTRQGDTTTHRGAIVPSTRSSRCQPSRCSALPGFLTTLFHLL